MRWPVRSASDGSNAVSKIEMRHECASHGDNGVVIVTLGGHDAHAARGRAGLLGSACSYPTCSPNPAAKQARERGAGVQAIGLYVV